MANQDYHQLAEAEESYMLAYPSPTYYIDGDYTVTATPFVSSRVHAERVARREVKNLARAVKGVDDLKNTKTKKARMARKRKSEEVSSLTKRMSKVALTN
ncbi:hypothetical protein M422DRAFT_37365 [Sphaerobolus stellatus SS14]|uniref:Uncharacterized protein n=1 Tax=Sphaerobolus stellatus (strain SS14) TaxID=990650 RepID=A0A0C9USV4_SPHS4|nr:hypothetical protein M422DRAFT_37365 [Sphaerobolus stellatus SS14]